MYLAFSKKGKGDNIQGSTLFKEIRYVQFIKKHWLDIAGFLCIRIYFFSKKWKPYVNKENLLLKMLSRSVQQAYTIDRAAP